jgi:putative addiction module component (TIGR02574 family)
MSPSERLALIGELWDSLDTKDVALTDEQRVELKRRQASVRANGPSGRSFDEIKASLLNEAS